MPRQPPYVTRFDGVSVPATDYRPVWLDSLAGDVTIEGSAMDGVVQSAEAVRTIVTYIRTLYNSQEFGHGRLELTKFHSPTAVSAEPENAPPSTQTHGTELVGELGNTRTAIGSVISAASTASSSHWPSNSAESLRRTAYPKHHPRTATKRT